MSNKWDPGICIILLQAHLSKDWDGLLETSFLSLSTKLYFCHRLLSSCCSWPPPLDWDNKVIKHIHHKVRDIWHTAGWDNKLKSEPMSELGSPSCQKQAILSNWNSRAPNGANKLAKLVDAMCSYNYLWLEEGLLNADWKSGKEENLARTKFRRLLLDFWPWHGWLEK